MPGAEWIDRRLVGFDLETTGLNREVEEPVSYAFSTFEGGEPVSVDSGWMLPTRQITRGAAEVHGLTAARLAALGASSHIDGLRSIERQLLQLSRVGVPVVGANLAYDLTIVDRSLGRLELPSSLPAGGWSGPALDVLVIDRALDADFAARPVRKLGALCEHYGVGTALHTAAGDATSAVGVLLAQVRRFPLLAEMSLDELYVEQAAWHRAWCDEYSARRVSSGSRPLDLAESDWPLLARMTLF